MFAALSMTGILGFIEFIKSAVFVVIYKEVIYFQNHYQQKKKKSV